MWVPDKKSGGLKSKLYMGYNFLSAMNACVVFTILELLHLPVSATNLHDLVKDFGLTLTHIIFGVKLLFWFHNRPKMFAILASLRPYERLYDPLGDFNPQTVFASLSSFVKVCSKTYLSGAVGIPVSAGLAWYYFLFFNYDIFYYTMVDANNNTEIHYGQPLPYSSHIPFDYTRGRFYFYIAMTYQVLTVVYFAFAIVAFDTFYALIMVYTSAHMQVVTGAFRTIRGRCLRQMRIDEDLEVILDPPHVLRRLKREMVVVTRHLQLVLESCTQLENHYTYITLVQLLMSLLVVCANLFLVSSTDVKSENFVTEVVFLLAIQMELAFYCYFGNQITFRAEEVPMALYQSDWFSTDTDYKRCIIINMMRMQKPTYFTIGKFSPLTLSTYVTITKTSYSLLAVLQNSED